MPPSSTTRLTTTTIPVAVTGGVVWSAWTYQHWSWWGLSTMVPTNPESTSLGDLKAILATALCMTQGTDYTTCDPYGRPFTPYVVPPARVAALLGLDLADAAALGIGLAVAYVVTIGLLGWLLQRHWRAGLPPLLTAQLLLALLAVSAPAMLGIERGQIEIVVLGLSVAGLALLAGSSRRGRPAGALVATLAVAGKYFAVGLFAPFVRRGLVNRWALGGLALSVLFLLVSWADLQQALTTSRVADPATSAAQFGAAALVATVLTASPGTGIPDPDVAQAWTSMTWAGWAVALIGAAVAALAIPRAASVGLDSLPVPRALVLGGSGVLALPFVLGTSHDYRQVFLLPVVVGALAWLSSTAGRDQILPWLLVLGVTVSMLTGASMIPTPWGLLGPDEFMWPKAALVLGDVGLLTALAIGAGLWLHGWRRDEG